MTPSLTASERFQSAIHNAYTYANNVVKLFLSSSFNPQSGDTLFSVEDGGVNNDAGKNKNPE
ncbi:MAG: hypothetical protein LLG02_05110 [Pelosinus sp.]|nr:hypothetical protein [Pelosinus sp.]